MKNAEKYLVRGVDLSELRNRNETKVAACMREELDTLSGEPLTAKTLQDVFALALNKLPARYAQKGTIVLREPVSRDMIRSAVREAFLRVLDNPKD